MILKHNSHATEVFRIFLEYNQKGEWPKPLGSFSFSDVFQKKSENLSCTCSPVVIWFGHEPGTSLGETENCIWAYFCWDAQDALQKLFQTICSQWRLLQRYLNAPKEMSPASLESTESYPRPQSLSLFKNESYCSFSSTLSESCVPQMHLGWQVWRIVPDFWQTFDRFIDKKPGVSKSLLATGQLISSKMQGFYHWMNIWVVSRWHMHDHSVTNKLFTVTVDLMCITPKWY